LFGGGMSAKFIDTTLPTLQIAQLDGFITLEEAELCLKLMSPLSMSYLNAMSDCSQPETLSHLLTK
jgi:hypothetical protein